MPEMTGLERLRELAYDMYGVALWDSIRVSREDKYGTDEGDGKTVNGLLRAIADQIEAEQEERVTRRVEDREAAEWVRKHNGIEYVKAHWEGRVARSHVEHMAECQRERRERMQRHIEYIQSLCRERRERIGELNREIESMRPRLMPEGMEWPRFEDGEPVSIGDLFAEHSGCENVADSVEVGDCWFKIHGFDGAAPRYRKRASVKRPEPKVLDADGVEIRVGDMVYALCDGTKHVVERIEGGNIKAEGMTYLVADKITHRAPVLAADGKPLREKSIVFDKDTGEKFGVDAVYAGSAACRRLEHGGTVVNCDPEFLTHERPVLDADGVPIKVGDTVYLLPGEWCGEFPLIHYSAGDGMVVKELCPYHDIEGVLKCVGDGKCNCFPLPYQLTHTKPEPIDSWERLEKDAEGIERDCGGTWHKPDGSSVNVVDLVRRAKELAGVRE